MEKTGKTRRDESSGDVRKAGNQPSYEVRSMEVAVSQARSLRLIARDKVFHEVNKLEVLTLTC